MSSGFASIVVIDVDAKIPLEERVAYARAQTRQILEHFAPFWGRVCGVRAATPDQPPRVGEIQLKLIDQPTVNGALGYHDVTPDGTPIAYVFTGLARSLGEEWTTIASHEVLEVLADPYLHRAVQTQFGFAATEVCDAVEQDSYLIDGVALSNFNTPEYFEPPANLKGVRLDYMGLCKEPGEVRPGGYSQLYDPNQGWIQIGAASAYRVAAKRAGVSRSLRRRAATVKTSRFRRLLRALRLSK